jgi:hypothetical protein
MLRSAFLQRILFLGLSLSTSILTSCGGGGSNSGGGGGGGNPPTAQTSVTTASGDLFLYGLAGSSVVFDVKVVDSLNQPVSNATVRFTASQAGVELYPAQVSTTSTGIATTVVHLPTLINTSFTVTGKADSGGSYTGTFQTGMRLVRTIGLPNASGGAVLPDGTYISGSTSQDLSGVYNPDGTLRKLVEFVLPSGKIPTLGTLPGVTQDGRPYYVDRGFISFLDGNFDVVNLVDLDGAGGAGRIPPVIGANGKIYTTACDSLVVHDNRGAMIGIPHGLYWEYKGEIFQGGCSLVVNSAGNPVMYGRVLNSTLTSDYTLVVEYDQNGEALQHAQLTTFPWLVPRPDGTYIAAWANVDVLDSKFQLKKTLFSRAWGKLDGVDNNNRFYFSAPDVSGAGTYRVLDINGTILFSNGDSDQATGPYPMYNQWHGAQVIAADDTSDSIYALQYVSSSVRNLIIYQNGTYLTSYPTTLGVGYDTHLAISPSRELYAMSESLGAGLQVYNLTGQLVKTLNYQQLAAVGIDDVQIDANGYKYLDSFEQTIHVLAPDDSYMKAITLPQSLPAERGFALTGDGGFVFAVHSDKGWSIEKLDSSGSVVWTVPGPALLTTDPTTLGQNVSHYGPIRVDAAGRIYYGSMVLDSNGKILHDVGFYRSMVIPKGNHVLMYGQRAIYELSVE